MALRSGGTAPVAIDRRSIIRAGAQCGAMLAYAAIFEPLGYLAATFVFASVVLRLQGIAWREAAGVSAALSLSTAVVFAGFLDVELPTGLASRFLP
jgi:putative tricarboxylic transport membrane protein